MAEDKGLEMVVGSFRDGKSDCDEGVESDAFALAGRTRYFGLVLACHKISNDRLITLDVSQPALSSNLRVTAAGTLNGLHIGLLFNTIQVFMQSVNEEGKEFL